MKKFINILIISFIIMLFPSFVRAYGINNYLINAIIENNGDLTVQEYFELEGEYNGFERKIYYSNSSLDYFDADADMFGGSDINNADNVELLEIKAVDKNDNFDFNNVTGDSFTEGQNVNTGEYGFYEITKVPYGYAYKIYLPSSMNKAFYIKYKLKDIAVMHNDVAEIFWNFVGNNLTEDVKNLNLYINIPNNTSVRAWAHGPLNGNVEIINNTNIKASITDLNKNTEVDVRIAFDKNVISNSSKKTNVDALDKILKYEQIAADDANTTRNINKVKDLVQKAKTTLSYEDYKNAKNEFKYLEDGKVKDALDKELDNIYYKILKGERKTNYEYIFYMSLLFTFFIIILFIIKKLNSKKIKSYFNNKYLREIPDVQIEIAEYIVSNKITSKTISAMTLNLIYKDVLTYNKIDDKEIELTLNENNVYNLNDSEKALIKYLFGNKKSVNLKEFKKDTKEYYDIYIDEYEQIENDIFKVINEQKLFKKYITSNCKKTKYSLTLVLIGIYLLVTSIIEHNLLFLALLLIILFVKTIIRLVDCFDIKIFITNITGIGLIVGGLFLSKVLLDNVLALPYSFYYITLISFIVFIICINKLKKQTLTDKGYEKLSKLLALKNFLSNFGKLHDKEVIEVNLWDNYLIYATSLGCSKKLSKEIDSKLDIQKIDNDLLDFYQNNLYYVNNDIDKSIRKTKSSFTTNKRVGMFGAFVSSTLAAVLSGDGSSSSSSSSSNRSSGSGSGGGFSSGGGSGGGGTGGSRF